VSDIFSDLLSEYWDAAYLEGKEGRTHDTKDGRAQHALSKIMAYVKQKDIEIERLRAEAEALRALCAEANKYLDTNNLTSIGHGSILHRKFSDATRKGG
jgi:hypothetical protein